MVAMYHLVGMITFWGLLQAGSARTDFPQMNDAELENFVQLEGSFKCKGTSCQCCVNVGLDFVPGSLEACINMKYLAKNIGIFVNISLQGEEIYSEEVSVRNPPPICPTTSLLKKIGKLCLEFYNMTFNEKNLAGCARISLKIKIVFSKEIPLGCFGTSLDEDSKIESIDENKIIGKTDQNERNRQTYTSSTKNDKISEIYTLRNQNERNRETNTSIIWETDTSSNLIARTEEKNIGNKQGSLHKNEGKMELNGLSLMLLLLINQ